MKYSHPKGKWRSPRRRCFWRSAGSAAYAQDVPSWCGPKKASLALLDGYRRQQLAPGHDGVGRGGSREVPEHHRVSICRRPGQHAEGHLRHQQLCRPRHRRAGGVRRCRPGGAAGPDQRLQGRQDRRSVPRRRRRQGRQELHQISSAPILRRRRRRAGATGSRASCPTAAMCCSSADRPATARASTNSKGLKSVLDDKYMFVNPRALRRDQLGSGADPEGADGGNRQERQDRRHRLRLRSVAGRRASGVQEVQRSIPALATSDGNSLGCFWTENQKDNPDFKLFTVATGNDNVRLAVQWAVALATGGTAADRGHLQGAELRELGDRASRARCSAVRTCPARSTCRPRCPATTRPRPSASSHSTCRGPGGLLPAGAALTAEATQLGKQCAILLRP